MKNIALCISGYFTNKTSDDLMKTNYIYENVINKIIPNNKLDIFIYSFDINNKDKILQKYPSVKEYIIEPQINLSEDLDDTNREFIKKLAKDDWYSSLSSSYSRKKSIMLAINSNIQYDTICWCRFDLGIRAKELNMGINCSELVFDPYLDNEYIYSRYWKQLNAGYSDFWFFSKPANMILLANMYDYILNTAFKPNSDYLIAFEKWPFSNIDDEFSNEILKESCKTDESKYTKYNTIHASNNHLLHKFYFLTCGLYNKSKFLNFTNVLH